MTALVLVAAAAFLAGSLVAARLTRLHLTEDGIWGDNRRYHLDLDAERQQAAEAITRAGQLRRQLAATQQVARAQAGLIIGERRPIPLGPRHLRRSPFPVYGRWRHG